MSKKEIDLDFKGLIIEVRPDDEFVKMNMGWSFLGNYIHLKTKKYGAKKDLFEEPYSSLDYHFGCFPDSTVYLSLEKSKEIITDDLIISLPEKFWGKIDE